MSQALRDLPDPLQPAPALPTSNPDDLLAKMADEAIDRLMADADRGTAPPPMPPAYAVDEAPAAGSASADDDEIEADELPDFSAKNAVAPPVIEAGREEAPAVAHASATSSETPAVGEIGVAEAGVAEAGHAEVARPAADPPPQSDAAVKALLAEAPQSPSPLLWPLRIINAPFAWLGDRTRTFVGLLGVVTLVPAAAAIVYVYYLKK